MTQPITRRALMAFGTVSLGALLAACRGNDAVTSANVSTSEGATASVEPQTSGDAGALFEGAATCTLTPEETEGPYYFDANSIRSDIREDRTGRRLRLALRVQDAAACTPIANAVVDIWHCDPEGVYSGFESASTAADLRGGAPGGAGGAPGGSATRTDDDTFLRGAQVTNADGVVRFVTIYPGWYRGRTVHVHAKVHLDNATVLTTQLFFDEDVTNAVYADEPYAEHTGRDTFNDTDSIFDSRLLLTLSEDGDGYLGVMSMGVDAA